MKIYSAILVIALTGMGAAQTPTPAPSGPTPGPLFAAVFRTGPAWDQAKPPNDQAFFREHSANLARLRQAGTIVIGARYSDVGLIVVTASSAADARKLFDADPSVPHGTFQLDLYPFNVIYGGSVGR